MNVIVIALVLIFIPGIIATIIGDKITRHSKWDSFKFGIYSLVLGIMSYVALQLWSYSSDLVNALIIKQTPIKEIIWSHLNVWQFALDGKPDNIQPWELCLATLFSVPVAFLASWVINFKLFNKIAQKIKVTTKYGDENLFSFYLNAKEIDWVYVRDIEANLTYFGEVVSYSENENIQELVLSDVSVYRYEGSIPLYELSSIYLCKDMGKFIIEAAP